MRCTNEGADYDADNVQWSCKASLPLEFKLGSTDVGCEGYESADDPYVLKGSCGVEYRLLLTEEGEAKYGKGHGSWYDPEMPQESEGAKLFKYLFLVIFAGVVFLILRSMYLSWQQGPMQGRQPRNPQGGYGGGGGDDNDDPPPPYDPYPRNYGTSKKSSTRSSTSTRTTPSQSQQQGWRPGFWSGTAAGAAAGYAAGRYNNSNSTQAQAQAQPYAPQRASGGRGLFGGTGSGANSFTRSPSSGSSSTPSFSSSRHESTGFGSTSRR
jgi:hypothetical protein